MYMYVASCVMYSLLSLLYNKGQDPYNSCTYTIILHVNITICMDQSYGQCTQLQ